MVGEVSGSAKDKKSEKQDNKKVKRGRKPKKEPEEEETQAKKQKMARVLDYKPISDYFGAVKIEEADTTIKPAVKPEAEKGENMSV